MKRIFSNLKPFVLLIVVCIVLLVIQAFSDLNLPNYMSDIVNVGIQQSGVEHASPDEISPSGYALVAALLPTPQNAEFEAAYEKSGSIYTIKPNVNREAIDILVGESALTLMNLAEMAGNQGDVPAKNIGSDFEIQKVYQIIPMLEAMDATVKEAAYQKAQANSEVIKTQTGIVFARLFYKELGRNLDEMQMHYIFKVGLQMLGVTLLAMLASLGVAFVASRIGSGFSRNLRRQIFAKVEHFSNSEFENFSSSSLVVRTTNDVMQIQQVVIMSLRMFFYAPIMAFGGVVMILQSSNSMSWIIVVAIVALSVLLGVVFVLAVPKFRVMQKFIDRLNLVYRENLNGIMVIRAFGNHEFENERFDVANQDSVNLARFVNRVMSFMMPTMMFLMNVTMLSILWFGGHYIADGLLQIGDMMAFMQYTMQIIFAYLMISMMFIFIPRAVVSMNRVAEVLNAVNPIQDPDRALPFVDDKQGVVEFDQVSFVYGDADTAVLQDISFTAKPGQTTAFIGSTGSGKSTLINLVPRFYDVTSGSVKVNGVDVRDMDQKTLHDTIGYVPQKGVLLSGTVASNLQYGKDDATEDEMRRALEIAQASFVFKSKEGLAMPISQSGTNVSGGQKQRLSIARALMKEAPIYIFDDSFSALDFKTDQVLRQALHENLGDATLLIVAQRVNTIMDADQILVLDNGKLVGKGTHKELLKTCPTYYEIAASQLTEEELNHA